MTQVYIFCVQDVREGQRCKMVRNGGSRSCAHSSSGQIGKPYVQNRMHCTGSPTSAGKSDSSAGRPKCILQRDPEKSGANIASHKIEHQPPEQDHTWSKSGLIPDISNHFQRSSQLLVKGHLVGPPISRCPYISGHIWVTRKYRAQFLFHFVLSLP